MPTTGIAADAATTQLPPVMPAAPSAQPLVTPAPVASAPAPAPPTPTPLAPQIAAPLFTLAGAKPGDHVLTVSVTPDALGPVTVRAHVGTDGVRVELFAPSDGGRDALRGILNDLRRDLAAGGMNAQLNLSSQNQPSDAGGQAAARDRPVPGQTADGNAGTNPRTAEPPHVRDSHARHALASTSTIDVLV